MKINMIADNARWGRFEDQVFATAKRAKDAIEKFGKENVIDSTLGALYDEDGKIISFESVYNNLFSLDRSLLTSYPPIAGTDNFLKNVIDICFADYKPDAYIKAVATPGGSGAVRHCIWTFAGEGDHVICPNWYWPSYKLICQEFNREFVSYELFTKEFTFNLMAFENALKNALKERDRTVCIFNTPANNPTGYSLSLEEWDRVLEIVNKYQKDDKKITLLIDVAYMEYAGDGSQKEFFKKFSNLSDNIFVFVAFSMSKAYTVYGMRSGAAIGISSNKKICDEVYYSLVHANRANWSNGNRGAMELLALLNEDEDKKKAYKKELEKYRKLLEARANAFIEQSKEQGLEVLPYFGGFFISIPVKNPDLLAKKLEEKNLFVVVNEGGLRFAICAVSKDKCYKSPKIIKEVLDNL